MAYQRGSGFVGLRDYLGANRQQGQALGGSVAGRLESDIANTSAGARTGLDAAVSGIQSGAAAGTPQYVEPTSYEEAQSKAGGAGGTVYSGPQGLSDAQVQAAMQGISDVGGQGRLGQTDAGVATLLQQQYGQGYTGVGGRSLDAALARRGAGERLDSAGRRGVEALRAYLGNATTQANEAVQQGMQRAADVRQQYATWQPPALGGDVRRTPIQTPGTMPDRPDYGRNTLLGLPLSRRKRP